MKTINIKDVKVTDGVYLDFDNGPVFLMQDKPDNILLVGADNTYRGEQKDLEAILKMHNNIDVAKTLRGENIVF